MISRILVCFFLKKQHGDTKVHRPIYLRITIDGVIKEMSVQRSWDPGRWDPATGRATTAKVHVRSRSAKQQGQPPIPDAEAKALNAYLDTLQAKGPRSPTSTSHERQTSHRRSCSKHSSGS